MCGYKSSMTNSHVIIANFVLFWQLLRPWAPDVSSPLLPLYRKVRSGRVWSPNLGYSYDPRKFLARTRIIGWMLRHRRVELCTPVLGRVEQMLMLHSCFLGLAECPPPNIISLQYQFRFFSIFEHTWLLYTNCALIIIPPHPQKILFY